MYELYVCFCERTEFAVHLWICRKHLKVTARICCMPDDCTGACAHPLQSSKVQFSRTNSSVIANLFVSVHVGRSQQAASSFGSSKQHQTGSHTHSYRRVVGNHQVTTLYPKHHPVRAPARTGAARRPRGAWWA